MRTIVTYKHVLDCISRSKHFELPCLLPDLKNFPPQEWHDCIRRVQQADSPSPENDESLRLLLNWGAENNWFQLLEQATAHVGEDTRFETDGWMKMVDEENREVCNGEKNMLSVSQHKYSSKYPNRELWCENSGYNVAAALFEEHPELSVKVVSGTKRSIYHSAAQKNASAILILAADVAQDNRLDNHDAINSRDGAKRTPLAWAVLYSHPRVVRTLFHIFPDLRVTESDLLQAINSQQKDIVTPLSEHRPRLININMVRRAMKVPDVKIPDFNIWKTLLRVLIKARPRADQKQSDEQFMEGTDLLHYAVQGRRLEMVQDLVKRFPTLTVQLPNGGHTVLWYNTSKNGEPRTAIQDEIRQFIVPVVIGLKSSVEDIRTFIGDDGKRKEVELDLNPGKAPPQAVSRFIQKICDLGSPDTAQEDRSVLAELEFESTLRYVDFPIFEMTKNNGSHMNDHDLRYGTKANHSRSDDIGFRDEAHSVLKWLRDRKGVRKIIEVRVADSQYHPHSEQVIEESLERFDVEILNWKRADLSVDSISIAAPNVKKLYLYSNGSKASIGHWAGSDGVGRLEKLEEIHVTFWTDHISRQQAASYGERAKAKLEGLRTKNGYSWSVTIEPPRKFCESGDPGDPRVDAPKLARVKPAKAVKIVDFLDGYQNLSRDILEYPTRYPELTGQLYPRIRVAVIDTGVDETLLDDTFRGISGQSFVVEEGKESMWWIAKELHGTRMAHIIHSLDPFCKLKIYKCGDARTDITKERVTRVSFMSHPGPETMLKLSGNSEGYRRQCGHNFNELLLQTERL